MEDKIKELNNTLAEEFEIDQEDIKPEENLHETLDLDSLDYIDLVVVVESFTGVKLEEEDFKNIVTFEDFYTLLKQRMA